ncbi:MAG TPA: hypothetical protein VIY48_20490, partial [Candidatus Paceibacterota bacterium]
MAKVTSPLHSLNAHGALGNTVIHTDTKHGHVAKRWAKPTGQPSANQTAQRAAYAAACSTWNTLSQQDKLAWNIIGQRTQISGFNAYLSANIGAPTPPHVPAYTLIDMPPNVLDIWATGMSADGSVIVGTLTTINGDYWFRWTQSTGIVQMDDPATALDSRASAVSADGLTTVGYSVFEFGRQVWLHTDADGYTVADLPVGWSNMYAFGLSQDGTTATG